MNKTMYMFDVDGVLCDIGSPTINPDIIKALSRLLTEKSYVAVNTGRGYDRIGSELIEPLMAKISNKNDLGNLFVSTEMGGELHTFKNGNPLSVQSEHSLTPGQLSKAREIFDQQGVRADTMQWYTPKKSMATVVKAPGSDLERFLTQKDHLLSLYANAFAHDSTVVVASTVESIDIHTTHAGKYVGAKAAYQWATGITNQIPQAIICFGDSHNDYEMARFFAHKDIPVRFVYTGTSNLNATDPHSHVTVITTNNKMSLGTLEYLGTL